MTALPVAIAAIAVWRLTHLLQVEDGPFDMFVHGRNWLRRMSLFGVTDCFYCLSLWVAAPFAMVLASRWEDRLMLWLALSGAAILFNRLAEAESRGSWFYEEPDRGEESTCLVAGMEDEY